MANVCSWILVIVMFAIGLGTAPWMSFPFPFSSSTLGSSSLVAKKMLKDDPKMAKITTITNDSIKKVKTKVVRKDQKSVSTSTTATSGTGTISGTGADRTGDLGATGTAGAGGLSGTGNIGGGGSGGTGTSGKTVAAAAAVGVAGGVIGTTAVEAAINDEQSTGGTGGNDQTYDQAGTQQDGSYQAGYTAEQDQTARTGVTDETTRTSGEDQTRTTEVNTYEEQGSSQYGGTVTEQQTEYIGGGSEGGEELDYQEVY